MSDNTDSSDSPAQRATLKERSQELLERLAQAYPAVFFPLRERRIKALKVGIHKDLIPIIKAWGYQTAVLKYALGVYTRHLRYQMALLKTPERIDLQGNPAGDITEAQRQIAQEKVAIILEKRGQQRHLKKHGTESKMAKPSKEVSPEAILALQKKLSRKATY